MSTAMKKGRTRLTNMDYNRVDTVDDGANQFADIKLFKGKNGAEGVTKAVGSISCNSCGAKMGKNFTRCKSCGSYNLSKVKVRVTKTVTKLNKKKTPKNDGPNKPNKSGTFGQQQLTRDDQANGSYVDDGDELDSMDADMEQSGVGKRLVRLRKDDISDVVNTDREKQMEGEDDDEDIENLAEKTPDKATARTGFKDTSNGAEDTTGATFKSRTAGLNSWDKGDAGSQVVAENAEQMYRSESEEDTSEDDPTDNTREKVVNKGVKVRVRKGEPLQTDNDDGIYADVDDDPENGDGTDPKKKTTKDRAAVAPPTLPTDREGLDKRRVIVRKRRGLMAIEALNLSVGLAENLAGIAKRGTWGDYHGAMEDFVNSMNAVVPVWAAGNSVSKSNSGPAQIAAIEERINTILKASPAAQMSSDASQGKDANEVDSDDEDDVSDSPKKTEAGDVTGMVNKGNVDIYKGLHPEIVAKMKKADEIIEKQAEREWLEVAKKYTAIPNTDVAKLAKTLRTLSETSPEQFEVMKTTLDAAVGNLSESAVFKQFGMSGGDTATDPMAAANAWADSQITKGAEGKTKEALVADYIRDHGSEFYKTTVDMSALNGR